MSTIKVFLRNQNIEIEGKVWDQIKHTKSKNRAITKEKPLTPDDIAKILDQGEILEKAFFLCLVSSGVRIGELLQITKEDIDMTRSPTKMGVIHDPSQGRSVKDRDSRTVYISDETTSYLKQ
jgi:integrase